MTFFMYSQHTVKHVFYKDSLNMFNLYYGAMKRKTMCPNSALSYSSQHSHLEVKYF